MALSFSQEADVPAGMRREIAEHGWQVAGRAAYPRVERRDRDGIPRPLEERDVRLAAACAGALSAFFVQHQKIFERDRFAPVSKSYQGAAGLTVRITVPYEAFEDSEDDNAAGVPRQLPKVGRNDPCPCGSGKKPREALRTRDGREQLEVLLKQLENSESRQPEGQRLDVAILRRQLGLAE
jgi:hypothetical protein